MSRPASMKVDGTVYWTLTTYDADGILVDADSTPTVAVRKNGASVADAVTVTKRSATTGIYDCSHNPAGEAEGDTFIYEESVTVSAQAYLNSWSLEVLSSDVNVVQISGDSVAADNLELQYDGTGLDGDTFPAYQAQVSNIALTGSAVNVAYTSYTLTTGTTASGAETDTVSRDGVTWEISDSGGTIDLIGDFQIDTDGIPTGVTLVGKLDDKNEQISVQAYDWVAAGWVTVGQLDHVGGGTLPENNFALFTNMVGEGVNSGQVRIRFFANGNLTGGELFIDQLYVSYAVINRSVGYSGGAVWSDDASGNTGVIPFIDGTADKRTGSYANAISVAASVGLTIYEWSKDDSVTMTQDHDTDTFKGFKYLLNVNNNKAPIVTNGAIVFGIDASTETHIFKECAIGDLQNGNGSLIVESDIICQSCVIEDLELPPVAASSVNVQLSGCVGLETGTFAGLGYIDFGNAAGTNHRVVASEFGGSITLKNMRSGDLCSISGTGTLTLDSSCTGGTVIPAGVINVIDNSATTTVVREGIITKSEVTDAVWDEAAADHVSAGSTGLALFETVNSTGNLETTLEIDGSGGYQFTALALENAPSGGGGLTVQQIVDGVWDEALSGHLGAGTAGLYLLDTGIVSVKLDPMLEADGSGGFQYTELALENAPAAAGGLTVQQIVDGVWDEAAISHQVVGSFGSAVNYIASTSFEDNMVDAVWNEQRAGHTTAGSFGFYLDSQVSAAGGGSAPTEADIYTYFTSSNRPDPFKADVSTLALEATVDAVGLTVTDSNLRIQALDDAAGIYAYFTAGSNEDVFKADVSALATSANLESVALVTLDTNTKVNLLPTAQENVDAWGNQAQGSYTTSGTLGYYLDAQVSSAGSGGSGLYQATVRVQDSSNDALQGARVNVDGTTLTLTTDSSGEVTFNLDSGVYLLEVSPPAGYDTPVGQVLTVSTSDPADTLFTLTQTTPPTGCDVPWIG